MSTTRTATDKLEPDRSHTEEVTQEAKAETVRQARNLAVEATEQLNVEASEQTRRISANLHDLGLELRQMADAGNGGTTSELALEASDRAHRLAGYLDSHEPAQILDDLRALARRRPGTFLAGAAVLGLVAGRLGRGLKDAGPSSAPQRPVTPYPPEPPRVAPPSERPAVFYGDERPVELSGPDYQSDLVEPPRYGGPEVQP